MNPKKSLLFLESLRCGASTKNYNGRPCRAPAVRGKKRCRMHGGAKNSGAQKWNTNALKHGHTTSEAKNIRKQIRSTLSAFTRKTPFST